MRVVPGPPTARLSAGQVYAVFRMLAHLAVSGPVPRKAVDLELVFVPGTFTPHTSERVALSLHAVAPLLPLLI